MPVATIESVTWKMVAGSMDWAVNAWSMTRTPSLGAAGVPPESPPQPARATTAESAIAADDARRTKDLLMRSFLSGDGRERP